MGDRMRAIHRELNDGRWEKLTFCQQMANVGSEVSRALNWREKGRKDLSMNALKRALELLDMTIRPAKGYCRLRELLRVREALTDFFCGDNEYGSSVILWKRYFDHFNYAARRHT